MMSLIRRKVTPKLLAANRANSLLSTGPRSELGKRNASRHMVKHGIFAAVLSGSMREMGESPEEYERQREALYNAFGPEDGFEEMLVEDMAHLRWRWRRLMRAESGLIASKKRRYEIEREIEKCRRGGAKALMQVAGLPELGFAGLPHSVEKCEHMVGVLRCLHDAVQYEGFQEDGLDLLKVAYGPTGPLEGIELKSQYQTCLKTATSGETSEKEERKRSFLAALDREVAVYERLQELCRARDLETTEAMKDAQLLPRAEDLQMILRCESGLERQFRRRLRQLVAWRRAKRQAEARENVEASAVEAE